MTFVEDELRRTADELFAGRSSLLSLTQLVELGWEELVADEPALAVATLAEAQGRLRGRSRLVELEMVRALGLDPAVAAIGLPWQGTVVESSPADVILLGDADEAPSFLVPVLEGDGVTLCELQASTLVAVPVAGVDPTAGWARVTGAFQSDVGTGVPRAAWLRAVGAGRLALAHEMVGVAQGMLDLAVHHVVDRRQFGVALGTFQAVQHRLADVHVDLEAARAIARSAWIGTDPSLAAAAHLAARRALATATSHCHQVMGAIGCTWEHDMHRFIRRGLILDVLLGPDDWTWAGLVESARSAERVDLFA
ncbi:MAG TPA: acyl-CoA dehydrogenase [Acidimicrobiales bacterium]